MACLTTATGKRLLLSGSKGWTIAATPIVQPTLRPLTLAVGPTQQFRRITDAMVSIAAQSYQDSTTVPPAATLDVTVNIDPVPGDPQHYVDDISSYFIGGRDGINYSPPWGGTLFERFTIQATPSMGMVNIPVTVTDAFYYGKGMFITGPSGCVFRRIKFSGIKTPGGYGNLSSVRFEPYATGDTTMEDCEILGFDNGVLGGGPGQKLTLRRVYIHDCGSGTGLTHNVYAGHFDELFAEDVLSTTANVGHLFKSRAMKTTLRRVRLLDGATGNASYCLNVPNGGVLDVDGLVTHKGPNASNIFAITIGEEDTNTLPPGEGSRPTSIRIRNWTALSEMPANGAGGAARALWNAFNASADIAGTRLFGIDGMLTGMFGATSLAALPGGGTQLSAMPTLDLTSPVLA